MMVPLLCCLLLGALSAEAIVVKDFDGCRHFFYKDQEPKGMDQNTVQICQVYGEIHKNVYFATLYSPYHKIPLYSAYYFNPGAPNKVKRKEWLIEPMLDEKYQAVNADYIGSGYDRGHLNPRSFQKGFGRDATLTLTNAAPMDPCFNRVHWYQWEAATTKFLNDLKIGNTPTTAYIITGTVPQKEKRMPPLGRVTVPLVVWTAVCVYYPPPKEEKSLSFGYMGANKADNDIHMMSIPQMNEKLTELYGTKIQIFTDDCMSKNYDSVLKQYMDILKKTDTLIPDDKMPDS